MPPGRVVPQLSALALVGQLGFIMTGCILAGFVGGRYVDGWLNSFPVFTLLMLLAGVGAGMVAVYRLVMKAVETQDSDRDKERSSDGQQ